MVLGPQKNLQNFSSIQELNKSLIPAVAGKTTQPLCLALTATKVEFGKTCRTERDFNTNNRIKTQSPRLHPHNYHSAAGQSRAL